MSFPGTTVAPACAGPALLQCGSRRSGQISCVAAGSESERFSRAKAPAAAAAPAVAEEVILKCLTPGQGRQHGVARKPNHQLMTWMESNPSESLGFSILACCPMMAGSGTLSFPVRFEFR